VEGNCFLLAAHLLVSGIRAVPLPHFLVVCSDQLLQQIMGRGYELLGFDTAKDYVLALKDVPKAARSRVFQRQSAGELTHGSIAHTVVGAKAPLRC
jgi:hypothetical protein